MPHLVKVHEKHMAQGFTVIASHVQSVDKAKVVGFCRSEGVKFTVTSHGRPQGDETRGIPQAYLFDWTGKLVAEGHPNKLLPQVDELMARAPSPILGGRELEGSEARKLGLQLKSNKGFGKITLTLQGRVVTRKAVTAGEAIPTGAEVIIEKLSSPDTFEVKVPQ